MSGVRYVDASDLGLKPGCWPAELRPDGEAVFRRGIVDRHPVSGEIRWVKYDGPRGWSVVVYND